MTHSIHINSQHRMVQPIKKVLLLVPVLILLSCSTAKTIDNSYVDKIGGDLRVAKVYFIRTMPVKYKGVADSRITVDINGEPLLKIDEGTYTLINIKPTKASITTHSRTMFTTQAEPIDVSRTREYNFIAGKTYFINLNRVNEEFRGIYYDPAPVTLEKARELTKRLRARGDARAEPIENITKVADIPAPSALEPALPENLYPGKPYLIKGNPRYSAPKQPEGKNEITFDKQSQPESAESPADATTSVPAELSTGTPADTPAEPAAESPAEAPSDQK
jgi:hypothetical protein